MTLPASDVASDLRRTVEDAAIKLGSIPVEAALLRPAPGKWSPKEIIGHLIDSAGNNHPRFVRAQLQEDLIFPGYEQNDWVQVQEYQSASWPDLVALWKAYNLHIAHVMATASPHERSRMRARHNLHEIAWRTVDQSHPTTLEYFMRDYVGHLKHHLGQIAALSTPNPSPSLVLLESAVCVVRDWRPEDAPSLARHANNRNVWRNVRDRFPHPYGEDDAHRFIQTSLAAMPRTNFAIVVGDMAVGSVGVILQTDVERISAELGYWLGEDHWGKGIGSAAARAATKYAFEQLDLHRIYAVVFVWNPASARVLEKAGFSLEGTLRRSAIKDGEIVDQFQYAIVREPERPLATHPSDSISHSLLR